MYGNKQDIIKYIKSLATELNKTPLRKETDLSSNTIRKLFGTYGNLLVKAGLKANRVHRNTNYYIDIIKAEYVTTGKIITRNDFYKKYGYVQGKLKWSELTEKAVGESNYFYRDYLSNKYNISDIELMELIYNELLRLIKDNINVFNCDTYNKYHADGSPCYQYIEKRFKTKWRDFLGDLKLKKNE